MHELWSLVCRFSALTTFHRHIGYLLLFIEKFLQRQDIYMDDLNKVPMRRKKGISM